MDLSSKRPGEFCRNDGGPESKKSKFEKQTSRSSEDEREAGDFREKDLKRSFGVEGRNMACTIGGDCFALKIANRKKKIEGESYFRSGYLNIPRSHVFAFVMMLSKMADIFAKKTGATRSEVSQRIFRRKNSPPASGDLASQAIEEEEEEDEDGGKTVVNKRAV